MIAREERRKEIQMRSCADIERSVIPSLKKILLQYSRCGVGWRRIGDGRLREMLRDGRASCKRESCYKRSTSRHFLDARAQTTQIRCSSSLSLLLSRTTTNAFARKKEFKVRCVHSHSALPRTTPMYMQARSDRHELENIHLI